MQDFRKLEVWQLNREFTVRIYRLTAGFPSEERFGLVSQMRRASVSIGSCIAEGCGRASRADTLRYFQMGFSSATELLHQLITSVDLEFLSAHEFGDLDRQLETIRRKLSSLMRKLRPVS